MWLAIADTIAALIVGFYLFLRLYPPFGDGRRTEARLAAKRRSPQFEAAGSRGGRFVNTLPSQVSMGFKDSIRIMAEMFKSRKRTKPAKPFAVQTLTAAQLAAQPGDAARVVWFGHSALLLQIGGKTLLLDPMLGKTPSPFPAFGGGRYGERLPISAGELPPIDAVLFSHDHYDHLDYGTIRRIKDKVGRFIVPLGVGAHLVRWGVEPARISEHQWGEELEWEGLALACTPARHFSGRSLNDRDANLWCSWVIDDGQTRVFFSGDSGYGPHFAEIGERYGPFDLTLMECGQYDERWAPIHMMPEETVQAHIDVRGKLLIPIHWGAFSLALHSWTDPVERAVRAAVERGVAICTPRIGEIVRLDGHDYPNAAWWREA
ncbi:MBL fold metallo-hydrolase [Paenibacillus athensensis]|uniref:MBL fold metallo-hydrolase n=1 Tax=Paenibacillus athensensis TaxID=1967502 RepID=UPI002E782F80|nr:MBL fold metallo-hydrolase [Paenibacillus athensensis]